MSVSPDSPFARTIFADREKRTLPLRRISFAAATATFERDLHTGRKIGWEQRGRDKAHEFEVADRNIYEAAVQLVRRERVACAQAAGQFSAEAAAAILSRPDPEPWAPSHEIFGYLKRPQP